MDKVEISTEVLEDVSMVQEAARDFSEKEIRPVVMYYDESQQFPKKIVQKMAALGFLGAMIPEKYGGAGLTLIEFIAVVEEISRVDPSIGLTVAAHNGLCLGHIDMFANEEQKRKYLPDLGSGEKLGGWALTEPGSGSDSAGMKTTAVRDGDLYILNGSKTFITNGSVGSTFVVTAITEKHPARNSISAFILEKGMHGFSVGKKENKLGMRASDTATLVFDDVRVPAANMIGAEGDGFHQAMRILDGGRIGIASLSVGLAQGALDACLAYVKQRRQFGKPLAEFQAIQWKIAEMATEITASRLMTQKAATLKMSGKDYTLAASEAKLFASESASRAANEAVQIFGGYGFMKEFPVEKFYRDVKLLTIGEGTSEVQKMVIAKNILK